MGSNSTVTTLELEANHIEAEGAASIAAALRSNTTVTEVNLGGNNIGPEGRASVAALCARNRELVVLWRLVAWIARKGTHPGLESVVNAMTERQFRLAVFH